MRVRAQANGVTVKAYAGTTGVLLAFNVTAERRAGLLGFAIERKGDDEGSFTFLTGKLSFPGQTRPDGKPHQPGDSIPTNRAPIQKFRWSDYRVTPGKRYEYVVHPVYGQPGDLRLAEGPLVTVQSAALNGETQTIFNRAVGASQAFASQFKPVYDALKGLSKEERDAYEPPSNVRAWLSRGNLEQILAFLDRAVGKGWAVDIAIYEFVLPDIVRAVEAAAARGAQVRIIYHSAPGKPKNGAPAPPDDDQTIENRESVENLLAARNAALAAGRSLNIEIYERRTTAIFHNKVIILSRYNSDAGTREPQAVLCGSTNFTYNGVYCQANVVQQLERPDISRQYLEHFEFLKGDPDADATRKHVDTKNALPDPSAMPPLFAGFSPRSERKDIALFGSLIRKAKRDVLFSTAFVLDAEIGAELSGEELTEEQWKKLRRKPQPLRTALLGTAQDPILRYGLEDGATYLTGTAADKTRSFVAAGALPDGIEGWLQEKILNRRGSILIHTKVVVIDFTSDSPIVISGSHNLSNNASANNDENFLIFSGNTDVADCYGCEVMRLYDHYRFRFREAERKKRLDAGEPLPHDDPLALKPSDEWTNEYFGGDKLKTLDRKRFSAEES